MFHPTCDQIEQVCAINRPDAGACVPEIPSQSC